MTTVIEGVLIFSALLVAFGIVATFGAIVERFLNFREMRRRNRRRREILPEPNTRAVIRRRGWNVPL
jgi:hypothetical protein